MVKPTQVSNVLISYKNGIFVALFSLGWAHAVKFKPPAHLVVLLPKYVLTSSVSLPLLWSSPAWTTVSAASLLVPSNLFSVDTPQQNGKQVSFYVQKLCETCSSPLKSEIRVKPIIFTVAQALDKVVLRLSLPSLPSGSAPHSLCWGHSVLGPVLGHAE